MHLTRTKIFGLAAVAGCSSYGIWHHYKNKDRLEFLALEPREAVQNLNKHQLVGTSIHALEGLYHLNPHKFEELAQSLNKEAWTHLCIYGSILCRFLLKNTKKIDEKALEANEKELNHFLQGMDLDDKKWIKALRWFSLNVCREDDLRCQDSPLEHRPSKMKRLNNLLQVLLYKSEHENCDRLVAEQVPLLLYNLLHTYRDEKNKNLVITVLKIMSNIAAFSEQCASNIANSVWLPTLSEMIVQPVLTEEPVLAHKILANMLFSFGASNYQLSSLVYELHRPDPDREPVLDIVFIHGFRGNLFRTWRQRDNAEHATIRFWPREWLPREFHEDSIRVIGVDYPSKLLQFGELVDTIEERSKKLITALENAGVGTRPVVFCAHSMGGLLAKEMLSRDEKLLEKTVGILFMGTPHKGTPVISSYLKYLRPTHDTKLLQLENELNRELHTRFMEKACDKIPLIVSLVEIKKSPFFGLANRLIVTPESSTFGKGAIYHIETDHYQLSKPDSIFSTNYCVVLNFVKDAIKLVKQKKV